MQFLMHKNNVLSCFYLLIFYFEKFSTWIWRLSFATYLKLKLSLSTSVSVGSSPRSYLLISATGTLHQSMAQNLSDINDFFFWDRRSAAVLRRRNRSSPQPFNCCSKRRFGEYWYWLNNFQIVIMLALQSTYKGFKMRKSRRKIR